jgi:hypothetical protein
MSIIEDHYIFIRYDIPGPCIWHEKFIIVNVSSREGGYRYILTISADNETYMEDTDWRGADIQAVRPLSALGQSGDVSVAQAYHFRRRIVAVQIDRLRHEVVDHIEEFYTGYPTVRPLAPPALAVAGGAVDEAPLAAALVPGSVASDGGLEALEAALIVARNVVVDLEKGGGRIADRDRSVAPVAASAKDYTRVLPLEHLPDGFVG